MTSTVATYYQILRVVPKCVESPLSLYPSAAEMQIEVHYLQSSENSADHCLKKSKDIKRVISKTIILTHIFSSTVNSIKNASTENMV